MQKVGVCRAFVVDTQNSAGGFFFRILALGIDVKNIHAIVVITNAARPIIFFKTAVRVSRCAGVHGVAGGVQNAVLVARRQDHVVEQTFRDGREAQSCGGRAQARGQGGTTRQDGQARQSQATQQHAASLGVGQRSLQNVLEVRLGAGVENGVDVFVGHGMNPETLFPIYMGIL
jgi:hypothetical protein